MCIADLEIAEERAPVSVKIDRNSSSPDSKPEPDVVSAVAKKAPLLRDGREEASLPLLLFLGLASLVYLGMVVSSNRQIKELFSSSSPKMDLFSVDPFNVTYVPDSQVTAQWNISFYLTNPYKSARVTYKELDVAVFYKNEFLGGTLIKPFLQQPAAMDLVRVAILASPATVSISNETAAAIEAERSSVQAVNFNLIIHARISAKVKGWYDIWFNCKRLKVIFSYGRTAGSMLPGPGGECDFDHHIWGVN